MADESESKGYNQIMIAEYHLANEGRSVAHLLHCRPTWDGEGFT
jgi:hypothetical protein